MYMARVTEWRQQLWSSIFASYWIPPYTIFESLKKFDLRIKWGCWYRFPPLLHTRWRPSGLCNVNQDSSLKRTHLQSATIHALWELASCSHIFQFRHKSTSPCAGIWLHMPCSLSRCTVRVVTGTSRVSLTWLASIVLIKIRFKPGDELSSVWIQV